MIHGNIVLLRARGRTSKAPTATGCSGGLGRPRVQTGYMGDSLDRVYG